MASINLYKIDSDKITECIDKITSSGFNLQPSQTIQRGNDTFSFNLYTNIFSSPKPISWNWILNQFGLSDINIFTAPKALLLIKHTVNTSESYYIVTFGSSYFIIDKYCEKDFAFDFAARMEYDKIKTTALSTPNLKRNKTINTYIDYSELDFDSGESFSKLKVEAKLDEEFELFGKSLEIGNSIHFKTKNETLSNIVDIILYVQETMTKDVVYKIPLFQPVKDEATLTELEQKQDSLLVVSFLNNDNSCSISIPELEIVGSKEVFNNNDDKFGLKYLNSNIKDISSLTLSEIRSFCSDKQIDTAEKIKKIKVIRYKDETNIAVNNLVDIIEAINDEKKCLLSCGKWYRFNDDYLSYLNDSIAEINTFYKNEYDFNNEVHDQYIDEKYDTEKDEPQYTGLSEEEIKKKLKKKYYAERCFNLLRGDATNFDNHDREIATMGVEAMDLYERDTKTMFAVKIGNSSSGLCYAVDQSLTSLKMYKNGKLTDFPEIEQVGLWFVLERVNQLSLDANGQPNLYELEMIMLKNRIDQWKKEVRLAGYKPVIYINYRI